MFSSLEIDVDYLYKLLATSFPGKQYTIVGILKHFKSIFISATFGRIIKVTLEQAKSLHLIWTKEDLPALLGVKMYVILVHEFPIWKLF